jgi:hypothetical protein
MRRMLLSALPAGLALGAFSAFGDGLPPQTVLHVVVALANAAAPWFAVAFFVGSVQRSTRAGAAAAVVALVVAVAAYYAGIYAGGHTVAVLAPAVAVWTAVAVLVAPLLGAAGAAWATGEARWRVRAAGLLAGALLAEAAYRLVQHQFWTGIDLAATDAQVALVDAAGGTLVAWLISPAGGRRAAFAIALGLAVLGAAGMWIVTELARAAIAG